MKKFFARFIELFTEHRVTMSSAALSYYLTMTFFPIVICLYTLLGRNILMTEDILDFISAIMPAETVEYLDNFMSYVFENYSTTMMLFALSVVIISASAGFRSVQNTIGKFQGGVRFKGIPYFIFSVILALFFVIVIYFGIIVMFMSKSLILYINQITPKIEIAVYWSYLRFVILFALAFLVIWLVYKTSKRKCDVYNTFPGAIISTGFLVIISYTFSKILSYAIKYPLVYGSLASIILLMFWLYCISLCLYIGALINVVIRDIKKS